MTKTHQYGRALDYYLRLGQSAIATIVEEKSLYNLLFGRLQRFMACLDSIDGKELSKTRGAQFLIDHSDQFPVIISINDIE